MDGWTRGFPPSGRATLALSTNANERALGRADKHNLLVLFGPNAHQLMDSYSSGPAES